MTDGIQIVGYTLIHFVWQGALLAAAAAAVLRLYRYRSANTRYAVACIALAAMLAAPVVTVSVLWQSGSEVAPVPDHAQSVAPPETAAIVNDGRMIEGHASRHVVWTGVERALPLVVLAWILGVTLLLGRMAGGLWRVHRLHAAALQAAASRWQAAGERLASRLGLRVPVHVVESAGVFTPTAVGWLRPIILLPIAALANLTPSQVEAILVHELVHVRRHDYLVNLLQTLAETLLFYHPGVWWISERIRLEREHCCDDVAVEVCGDAVNYAAALTELEAWRTEDTSLAPAATGGSLVVRVRRILGTPKGRELHPPSWLVIVGLTIALVVGVGRYLPLLDLNPAAASTTAEPRRDEPIASPDTFDWRVHLTDHFEIHYYPALDGDLPLVKVAAEQAYQRVSSELSYNVPPKVPLVLFKTRSDFEQQEIAPGASAQWVTSFSEPIRNRIVLLVEDGDDVYTLIAHELTHIFMFDIVPRETTRRNVPVWIDEGLAEYMTGVWKPDELLDLSKMVAAGSIPDMSTLPPTDRSSEADGSSPIRRAMLLGHAAFEFIEARYGKESIRQFPFELRRDVVDGTGDLYQAAFNMAPDEFDAAFEQYLRERFANTR